MASSGQLRNDIARMQESVAELEGQIGIWRQRIAELKEDRAGLEGFFGQVRADKSQFDSTLARKRSAAARASRVADSRIAAGMSAMLSARFGNAFESGVTGNFNGIFGQIRQAIERIDAEIRQLGAKISAAEHEIARLNARIDSTRDQYRKMLEREHAEM